MRIAVGSDHAGFGLKQHVAPLLQQWGHEVVDCGADNGGTSDYPIYAARVAKLISEGQADRGVLFCGSGTGMAIVANKFKGVRAVDACDREGAELSRRHNDTNALCIGGRIFSLDEAGSIVEGWLAAHFEGGGRHARRLAEIEEIEQGRIPDVDPVNSGGKELKGVSHNES